MYNAEAELTGRIRKWKSDNFPEWVQEHVRSARIHRPLPSYDHPDKDYIRITHCINGKRFYCGGLTPSYPASKEEFDSEMDAVSAMLAINMSRFIQENF